MFASVPLNSVSFGYTIHLSINTFDGMVNKDFAFINILTLLFKCKSYNNKVLIILQCCCFMSFHSIRPMSVRTL